MVNSNRCPWSIFTALLLIIFSTAVNAQPVAKVDRTVVAVDESFTLTLSINKVGSVSPPSLSGLTSNFDIIGNSQSSNHTFTNGVSESITQWHITLMPKHVGQLLIPAIMIDGQKTQPITIDVRPSIPTSPNDLAPVYLETEVDQNEVFIQQQLIYTLRIFQSVQLDNMNVSEPEFDDAAIKKLSQSSYQRRIKNTPYRVHELRYAIFPQQSGELTIPEAVFTANATVSRRSIFSLPGQGKAIRKMSKQHTIKVNDVPSSFQGKTWLPAESIELEQSWSSNVDNIRVGESITRNITIKAQGLMDSQLPPIEFVAVSGVKYYPDQAQTDSNETDQGVSSSRTDSTAFIPTREGTLTLPEIRIHWWDTQSKKMRIASIPESTIAVKAALEDTVTSIPTATDHSAVTSTIAPKVVVESSEGTLYWQMACAFLGLAWLATLYLLLTLKRQIATKHLSDNTLLAKESTKKPLSEKQAFNALVLVCKNNDLKTIRTSVIQWAQTYWPQKSIHSLQDVQKYCNNSSLVDVLLKLDCSLYGSHPENTTWNGDEFINAIKLLRDTKHQQGRTTESTLAPLYPTSV